MKNKIITLLAILLFITCFWRISYAAKTALVYLQSNSEIIEKGQEIEITVNTNEVKTAAFNFSLYFDDSKLEYISNLENVNVIGNRIVFVWYDLNGGEGAKQGKLAKFKFRAKEEGIATFTVYGEFYSEQGQLIQSSFKEKQIQIGKEKSNFQIQSQEEKQTNSESNNANLQVLRLDKEGITPNFEKDIYEYYLSVSNDIQEIEVLAISENFNANIEITGNTNLKEGLNTINIEVTSEDKTQKNIYKIEVTKTANLELANSNLEVLAIENTLLNPPFDANETNYKVEVSSKVQSINIFAAPQNEQASVVITGKDDLKQGNNLVTVVVIAPNGYTKKKYQIEVYKRNDEEENKYNEEISKMEEKLEAAYEVEKLNNNEETNSKNKVNIVVYIIIGASIILILGGVVYYIKNKKI